MSISRLSGWEFNENRWVVSLLNTGSKLTGHAVIVVEGINQGQLFIGQYDVRGKICVEETTADIVQRTIGNYQGYIAEIRVIEHSEYTRDYEQFSRKSWYAHPENVHTMIDSIKNAQQAIEQAKENGEELPFKYQTAGSGRAWWLGGNGGESCVTWAEKQLLLAHVGNGPVFGDWIKAMPQLHTECVIS